MRFPDGVVPIDEGRDGPVRIQGEIVGTIEAARVSAGRDEFVVEAEFGEEPEHLLGVRRSPSGVEPHVFASSIVAAGAAAACLPAMRPKKLAPPIDIPLA